MKIEDTKLFKFAIWIYQKTGYVNKILIKAENRYLVDNAEQIFQDYMEYLSNLEEDDDFLTFDNYFGIKLGSWQGRVGMCRGMYTLINPIFGYKGMFKHYLKKVIK